MKIAVIGLGKMGMQIVQKLGEAGHSVIANDLDETLMQEASGYGALAAKEKNDVIASFDTDERVVLWIMIPAQYVDSELELWASILPQKSIIIDGGNSDYRLTRKRAETLRAQNLYFIDCGTSGGVWGYQNGFSMMIGSDTETYEYTTPIYDTLAQPRGMHLRVGDNGAGHYVKMVHNAIEYGMMQSLAEGYRMLKEGVYSDLDLGSIGTLWQHGSVVQSWLNELTQQVVENDSTLSGIDGVVAESGETRWTLETAQELGLQLPAIQAAFDVRLASQRGEVNYSTMLLAAMRNQFGGHAINLQTTEPLDDTEK